MPHLMLPRGRGDVMIIRPTCLGQPMYMHHSCPYRISKTDEVTTIKDCQKCMVYPRELLGSNIVRRPRIGDKMISILNNGELGPILFYDILPKRGYSRSYKRGVGPRYNVLLCATM